MKAVGKIIGAALVAAGFGAALAGPALAETELSFYTGYQAAPHSRVEGNDPGGVGDFSFLSTWEGRPFEMPPYYGFRATYWLQRNPNLGFGLDFSHNKVYADDETLATNGFDRLEFTDGLNTITANVWYRWPGQWMNGRLTPYVGAGAGLAIPHVDVETAGGKTFEYQLTGAAVQAVAGIKYSFNDRWAVFGEYKGTYSMNEADLASGGTLKTDVVTNAINIGVSFSF
ncbi:outer membrane protein [Psychromarinibacter halotolerans]|uniref:Outer membrane protein n=1 Tax=Psychromarinibacter halotolerans TaxID=1775175 RepID=A0ABV7GKD3_9RHOB|nr:outer membrane beta-barrel protein [Psychromarinibacter halotolerans]MAQ83379.1 lipid A oxidase [Maritimibacter sp.]MDF0595687.1 outer membrane beta-barrel protein [Psychromarinibacter halotolerans]